MVRSPAEAHPLRKNTPRSGDSSLSGKSATNGFLGLPATVSDERHILGVQVRVRIHLFERVVLYHPVVNLGRA
jgi:hypothetical protein